MFLHISFYCQLKHCGNGFHWLALQLKHCGNGFHCLFYQLKHCVKTKLLLTSLLVAVFRCCKNVKLIVMKITLAKKLSWKIQIFTEEKNGHGFIQLVVCLIIVYFFRLLFYCNIFYSVSTFIHVCIFYHLFFIWIVKSSVNIGVGWGGGA